MVCRIDLSRNTRTLPHLDDTKPDSESGLAFTLVATAAVSGSLLSMYYTYKIYGRYYHVDDLHAKHGQAPLYSFCITWPELVLHVYYPAPAVCA